MVVVVVVVVVIVLGVVVDIDVVLVNGFSVVVKSLSLDLECKTLANIMRPNNTPIEAMISHWRPIFKD